jgi:hypothetical protein
MSSVTVNLDGAISDYDVVTRRPVNHLLTTTINNGRLGTETSHGCRRHANDGV